MIVSNWGWGQAAVSLLPDVDGTSSGSLPESILSTFLKKWSSDDQIVALFFFFLIIHDSVALDCILNGCCNLRVPFYIQVLHLKTNSASSDKENPLAVSCIASLFASSVTSSPCHCILSITFTFVSIAIPWCFLAVPATSPPLSHLVMDILDLK